MTDQQRKCKCTGLPSAAWCGFLPIVVFVLCLHSTLVLAKQRVRIPAVAGYFYPEDGKALKRTVDNFISNAGQERVPGKILGLMCPHAGYVFSGQVAAYSYRQIQDRNYDTVIVIGPSHRFYLKGASVGNWDAYVTPLGRVAVNREIVNTLLDMGEPFQFVEQAHITEHSVETQIPFLQRVLKDFDIVPILMGMQSLQDCERVSMALSRIATSRNILFVASSDMSHYPDYTNANKVDRRTLSLIEQSDPEAVFNSGSEFLQEGIPNLSTTLCGLSSVVTVMMTAKRCEGNAVKILHYANSGDIAIGSHREKRRVVGYGAVAFYKK